MGRQTRRSFLIALIASGLLGSAGCTGILHRGSETMRSKDFTFCEIFGRTTIQKPHDITVTLRGDTTTKIEEVIHIEASDETDWFKVVDEPVTVSADAFVLTTSIGDHSRSLKPENIQNRQSNSMRILIEITQENEGPFVRFWQKESTC